MPRLQGVQMGGRPHSKLVGNEFSSSQSNKHFVYKLIIIHLHSFLPSLYRTFSSLAHNNPRTKIILPHMSSMAVWFFLSLPGCFFLSLHHLFPHLPHAPLPFYIYLPSLPHHHVSHYTYSSPSIQCMGIFFAADGNCLLASA